MHSQLFIIKTKMKSKKQIIYTKMIYTNSRIVSRIRRDMINLKKCHMRAQKFIYDAKFIEVDHQSIMEAQRQIIRCKYEYRANLEFLKIMNKRINNMSREEFMGTFLH